MEKKEGFADYCKNYVYDHIYDHVGRVLYACDIASEITQSDTMSGSVTYSARLAREYLIWWWDDCANFEIALSERFGEHCGASAFTDSEAFMMNMVVAGVESLLEQCDTIQKNNKLTITRKIANKIVDEIKNKEVKL